MSSQPFLLPRVPEHCLVCGAEWRAGCQVPGERFPKLGLRVFYVCGSTLSVASRVGELELQELAQCEGLFFLRLSSCCTELQLLYRIAE